MTSLWSRLPAIHLHKKTPRSYVAQINELLLRSRDAPISFNLYASFKDWESHPIIDALTRHSDRWQAVIIDSTTNFSFKEVKGRLSFLRTLSLHMSFQHGPVVFDMFEDAPQLREVHVGGTFHGEFRLPFAQLTRYTEHVEGRRMIITSLGKSLTVLEISRSFESPDIPFTTLPFLAILKVKFVHYRHGFLDRLTLPVIQEIWISAKVVNLITDIIDMISHSHSPCILKKFALRVSRLIELNSGELTGLLSLTPDLVALNLPLPPLKDLTNLIIEQNSRPLVPLLQTLTIDPYYSRCPETNQLLNAMAVSRCSLQDTLTSAVPHFAADRQALKELRIIFDTSAFRHYQLRFLEGWVPSEGSEQLVRWKENLLWELPELMGQMASEGATFGTKSWCEGVFDVLSDIEKFHVKDVNDIYISEMHTILRRLTNQPVTSILSQFGDRAGEILEKWTPLFESHLQERRWVLKGDCSVVYLSSDDPLRLSLTDLDIVYGLKDNLGSSEIFWYSQPLIKSRCSLLQNSW